MSDRKIEETKSPLEVEAKLVLQGAIEILETKGWCQDRLSRDKYGGKIHFASDYAESFCMMGALYRSSFKLKGLHNEVIDMICREVPYLHSEASIVAWNDTEGRTKEQVIAKLKKTLAKI